MSKVRVAAARALLAVERAEGTLAAELERVRGDLEDPRDRALLVELTSGTLRWRAAIDAIVTAVSRRNLDQIDARARAVVRLGIYQLRYLERVPAHAIVNESVEAVRTLGRVKAAGFVNAVLRGTQRMGSATPLPPRPGPRAGRVAQSAYLTTTLSHPAWLVERWLGRYGYDAVEQWCTFNNASPSLTVRTPGDVDGMLAALAQAGVAAERAPFVADAIRLPPGTLGKLPAELREALRVQDEGSQLVARAVGARGQERVVDLCAAPGGKTLILAADMQGSPLLVAADHRRARVALLRATLERAGVRAPVLALDVRRPLPFGPVFDRVLLDAPCSGLGTLRRDPDLKWSRSLDDLDRFASAQAEMLRHAAAIVRPGGELIYATCSSEPEENDDRIREFLHGHAEFAAAPRSVLGARVDASLINAAGQLQTRPDLHGLDAFFAAVLVRRQSA